MAQREAQKQQQQLQALAYDALAYSSSPHGILAYPPGYPIQTYVDPTNPNAGKVLLPTPAVEPLPYEQTPPPQLGLASPSPTSQAPPASGLTHMAAAAAAAAAASLETAQYAQPSVAAQDPAVAAVLSMPAQAAAGAQVQGQQSYAPLWDPAVQQALTVQAAPAQPYPPAPAAQPQAAIYYQGQPCQAVYSIPTAYPPASAPVIQVSPAPALPHHGPLWDDAPPFSMLKPGIYSGSVQGRSSFLLSY